MTDEPRSDEPEAEGTGIEEIGTGEPMFPEGPTRAGIAAVLGAPNAGKSTLVNRMVGAKVSIVTHKVQTTRARIRGIAVEGATQIVYVDTPGIFSPRRRLDRAMVEAAWEGAEGADVTLLLVDAPAYLAAGEGEGGASARRTAEDTDRIVENMATVGLRRGTALVLNKIDLIARDRLLSLIRDLNDKLAFEETFLISATRGTGIEDLRDWILGHMPDGPFLYPADQLSDISDRLMAAEITREKLFLRLHQELPYSLTVETEEWGRTSKDELRIGQTVYVQRESQRALVLGQKGRTIAAVGKAAREELTELLGEKVHLFLFVKVRQNWMDDDERLTSMGLSAGGRAPGRR